MEAPRPFLDALRQESRVGVRHFLKHHPMDLNSVDVVCEIGDADDPDTMPLLFWVIATGISDEMIAELVAHGMRLDRLTREGLGAIDVAIKHRRKAVVALCVKQGIDPRISRRRSGMTPLMVAASFGDQEMVEYLLEFGVPIDAVDSRGMDAAGYARMLGHTAMQKFLEDRAFMTQKEKQGA